MRQEHGYSDGSCVWLTADTTTCLLSDTGVAHLAHSLPLTPSPLSSPEHVILCYVMRSMGWQKAAQIFIQQENLCSCVTSVAKGMLKKKITYQQEAQHRKL